jgi:chromosome segregation ATPase
MMSDNIANQLNQIIRSESSYDAAHADFISAKCQIASAGAKIEFLKADKGEASNTDFKGDIKKSVHGFIESACNYSNSQINYLLSICHASTQEQRVLELKKRKEELELTISEREQQQKKLKQELDTLRAEITEARHDTKNCKHNYNQLTRELCQLKNSISDLPNDTEPHEKLKFLVAEISSARDQLFQAEESLKNKQLKLSQLKHSVSDNDSISLRLSLSTINLLLENATFNSKAAKEASLKKKAAVQATKKTQDQIAQKLKKSAEKNKDIAQLLKSYDELSNKINKTVQSFIEKQSPDMLIALHTDTTTLFMILRRYGRSSNIKPSEHIGKLRALLAVLESHESEAQKKCEEEKNNIKSLIESVSADHTPEDNKMHMADILTSINESSNKIAESKRTIKKLTDKSTLRNEVITNLNAISKQAEAEKDNLTQQQEQMSDEENDEDSATNKRIRLLLILSTVALALAAVEIRAAADISTSLDKAKNQIQGENNNLVDKQSELTEYIEEEQNIAADSELDPHAYTESDKIYTDLQNPNTTNIIVDNIESSLGPPGSSEHEFINMLDKRYTDLSQDFNANKALTGNIIWREQSNALSKATDNLNNNEKSTVFEPINKALDELTANDDEELETGLRREITGIVLENISNKINNTITQQQIDALTAALEGSESEKIELENKLSIAQSKMEELREAKITAQNDYQNAIEEAIVSQILMGIVEDYNEASIDQLTQHISSLQSDYSILEVKLQEQIAEYNQLQQLILIHDDNANQLAEAVDLLHNNKAELTNALEQSQKELEILKDLESDFLFKEIQRLLEQREIEGKAIEDVTKAMSLVQEILAINEQLDSVIYNAFMDNDYFKHYSHFDSPNNGYIEFHQPEWGTEVVRAFAHKIAVDIYAEDFFYLNDEGVIQLVVPDWIKSDLAYMRHGYDYIYRDKPPGHLFDESVSQLDISNHTYKPDLGDFGNNLINISDKLNNIEVFDSKTLGEAFGFLTSLGAAEKGIAALKVISLLDFGKDDDFTVALRGYKMKEDWEHHNSDRLFQMMKDGMYTHSPMFGSFNDELAELQIKRTELLNTLNQNESFINIFLENFDFEKSKFHDTRSVDLKNQQRQEELDAKLAALNEEWAPVLEQHRQVEANANMINKLFKDLPYTTSLGPEGMGHINEGYYNAYMRIVHEHNSKPTEIFTTEHHNLLIEGAEALYSEFNRIIQSLKDISVTVPMLEKDSKHIKENLIPEKQELIANLEKSINDYHVAIQETTLQYDAIILVLEATKEAFETSSQDMLYTANMMQIIDDKIKSLENDLQNQSDSNAQQQLEMQAELEALINIATQQQQNLEAVRDNYTAAKENYTSALDTLQDTNYEILKLSEDLHGLTGNMDEQIDEINQRIETNTLLRDALLNETDPRTEVELEHQLLELLEKEGNQELFDSYSQAIANSQTEDVSLAETTDLTQQSSDFTILEEANSSLDETQTQDDDDDEQAPPDEQITQ